jgi:hypothetical protein
MDGYPEAGQNRIRRPSRARVRRGVKMGLKRVSSRRIPVGLRTRFCSRRKEILQPFDFRLLGRDRCGLFQLAI